MDWSDPAVQFGPRRLDAELRDFCGPTLEDIRARSLELLDSLRASRVTLEYLRKVSSVDVVSGRQLAEERTLPSSLMTPLDDRATNKVKGYLRRRVEKLKSTVAAEFRSLVPQNRDAFEKGFDAFVEKCMDTATHIRNTWFEEHVASGAAQPQLWKIYIAFQRQLRDACEAQSRKPLPPPLFATKQDDEVPVPPEHLRPACHRPVTHFERSGFRRAQSSHRHCRAQSCAEFGRLVPAQPYVFHGGLVNIPCLPVQPTYHLRHESVPGFHAASPNDVRRDFTEQWIARARLQDDNDLLYSCYENAMFPAGFHFVMPGVYGGKPPKTVAYSKDYEHGN